MVGLWVLACGICCIHGVVRWALGLPLLVMKGWIAGLVLVCAGCGSQQAAVPTSTVTDTVTVTAAPVAQPAALSTDGMFVVGQDVQPGTYRTAGPADPGNECYWKRVSDLTGSSAAVLAFNFSQGQQVVEILPTDMGFQTKNCQPWTR